MARTRRQCLYGRSQISPLGLGSRLNEISAFVAGMDHQKVTRAGRGEPDTATWCFKQKEEADAFRARFGGTRG